MGMMTSSVFVLHLLTFTKAFTPFVMMKTRHTISDTKQNYIIGENIAKNASFLKRSIMTDVVDAFTRKLDVLHTVRSAV